MNIQINYRTIRYLESPSTRISLFFFSRILRDVTEEYFPLGTNHPLNPGQPRAITDEGWVQPWVLLDVW